MTRWRTALATGLLGLAGPVLAAGPCAGVARLHLPQVRIARTTEISPERPLLPPYPGAGSLSAAFCRIEGTIEQEIGFELWLPPRAAWNRRLLVGGVGGQAGTINYREMERGIRRGYAVAGTDSGHKASDAHWLLHRPDRAANYAGRANHVLAVKVKAMLAVLLGAAPRHAFFVGCSGGGRQALTEVQRYPRDFDGVIAGAPGVNTPEMSARRMWEMQRHSEWGAAMPAAAWRLVQQAAVRQCDGLDGVTDGVVDDPRICRFDPASLLCAPGQGRACLTPMQVAAVRTLLAPLQDEAGKRLDDGLLPTALVSPAPLPEPFTPGPSYLATVLFADGVHGNPDWDLRQFRLDRDLPAIDRVMNLHADNPAIEPFVRRGGKLILYHGWDDPLVSPLSTLSYWQALRDRFGPDLAQAVRLFMVPGMDHCRGGAGADQFGGAGGDAPVVDAHHDLLAALEAWVLGGGPPETVIAVRAQPIRSRLLCAWPARARHDGAGDPDQATSYACRLD